MIEDCSNNHTFVICAYEKSVFLEEVILSLKNQTVKSEILIATSTDNSYIRGLAKKYGLKVIINSERKTSIGKDFNFAAGAGKTNLVTVVHQDDKYEPNYCEEVTKAYQKHQDALIIFSDYAEIRNGKIINNSILLQIKRMLLSPLRINNKMKWFKRSVISFGNPILCPAVTLNMKKVKLPIFDEYYKSNVDWYAWEKLSKEEGRFVYLPKKLAYHRIHNGQETVKTIKSNIRREEDYEMFMKFWPKLIAKILSRVYRKAEKFYK